MSEEAATQRAEESIFDRLGDRPPMAETVDWTLIRIDKAMGAIHLSFTMVNDFTNPLGQVHGGFVAAMLDECMGSAIIGITDAGFFPITISLSTQFLKPVPVAKVFGEGRVRSMGKNSAFLEATLHDSEGQALAHGMGAYRLRSFDDVNK